jgi:RimJ/RimL family protein N-acetyltransferase
MMLTTPRLILRPWIEGDLDAFAAMNADPEVMVDMPALDRGQSAAKLRRYQEAYDRHGYCRWALTDHGGDFLGYAGPMPLAEDHPCGPGAEIGWRLTRAAWGHGYVTEGAAAALKDAFERIGLAEVVSFTAPDNARSQAVMGRLNLTREPDRDFTAAYPGGDWSGLVWVARAPGPQP